MTGRAGMCRDACIVFIRGMCALWAIMRAAACRSVRFVGKIAFAEARSKDNAELVEEYGITTFPTLVIIPAEGDHIKYAGRLSTSYLTCQPFVSTTPDAS